MSAAQLPASYCPQAVHALVWDETQLAWVLTEDGRQIGNLPAYPIDGPPVDGKAVLAWADSLVGEQQWHQHPPRAAAFHTHAEIPTSGCIACGATNLDPPCDCASNYSLRSI